MLKQTNFNEAFYLLITVCADCSPVSGNVFLILNALMGAAGTTPYEVGG